jgi:two-component sensor histidine kinase
MGFKRLQSLLLLILLNLYTVNSKAEQGCFLRKVFNQSDLPNATLPIISITQDENYKLYILTKNAVYHQTSFGYKLLLKLNNLASNSSQILVTNNLIYCTNMQDGNLLSAQLKTNSINTIKCSTKGHAFINNNKLYFFNNGVVKDADNKVVNNITYALNNVATKGISTNTNEITFFDKIINNNHIYVCKNAQWYQQMHNSSNVIKYYTDTLLGNTAPRIVLPLDSNNVLLSMDEPNTLAIYNTSSTILNKIKLNAINSKSKFYHASLLTAQQVLLLSMDSKTYILDLFTKKVTPFTEINKYNLDLKNLSELVNNTVWIGTYSGSVLVYNVLNKEVKIFDPQTYNGLNDVYRLQKLNDTLVAIGMSKGYCIGNTNNNSLYFSGSNTPKEILENSVTAFTLDNKGILWLGSYQKGLWHSNTNALFSNPTFTHYYKPQQFVELDIRYLNFFENEVWVRCKNGLATINPITKSYKYFAANMGFCYPLLNQMNYTKNNNYYSGVNGGFCTISTINNTCISPTVADAIVNNKDTILFNTATANKLSIKSTLPYFVIYPYNYGTAFPFVVYTLNKDTGLITNDNIYTSPDDESKFELTLNQYDSNTKKLYTIIKKNVWYKSPLLYWLIGLTILLLLALLIKNVLANRRIVSQAQQHEINSLRSQMNPHFISNSLNSINAYILENKSEQASDYIVMFSKLIRQILTYTANDFISIEKEVDMLSSYIKMEQLRFKQKFDFTIEVHPSVDVTTNIPSMGVQPFVENAIWHGILQNIDKQGWLQITFNTLPNGDILVQIFDNGIGLRAASTIKSKSIAKHKSMGLDLLQRRLNLLNNKYNKNYSYAIQEIINNNQVQGTQVTINY